MSGGTHPANSVASVPRPKTPPPAVAWRDWPLVGSLRRSVVPGVLLAVVLGVSWLRFGASWLTAVPVLLVFLTLAKWWLPTYYQLSSHGLRIQFCGLVSILPWRSIGDTVRLQRALLLVPPQTPYLQSWFRGVFLPLEVPPQQASAILVVLAFYHPGPIYPPLE